MKPNALCVGVSESGYRCGETHHRAKLSDHDIDLIRDLHEEGLGYRRIAAKFEISPSAVRHIVKCNRRFLIPVRFKIIHIPTEE